VYGPNTNDLTFYDFLQGTLSRWKELPAILGGDWNATFSNLPLDINPDVFSMRAVPSTVRTERILQLCEEFSLSDPYRSLHPDWKDYTYIPAGDMRLNRSRIDFFLVSDSIFDSISACDIAQSFCKKSFDHKKITLSFKKIKKKGRKCINNRILENPLLDCAIKLAIWECYLTAILCIPGGLVEAVVYEECVKLNNIDTSFNELVFLQGKAAVTGLTEEETANEERIRARVAEAWTDVISYERLQNYPRNCDDDIFFESLIMYTSKAAMTLQSRAILAENCERTGLLGRLKKIKQNDRYEAEFDTVKEIESRLNQIEEKINEDKVTNYLKSQILDNEKITPHFLRLAKTLNPDSLEKIRKPDGTAFNSNRERENYIVGFYKSLYSLPENMPENFNNCIEDFLGPDICANPVVINSKINDQERNELENPLSINELDESVKKLNLRSAPGIDGVSNRFISKFWIFLREPLHRYATTCIAKGELTETFRTAVIRLIPKKGDTTQLKNWRPISLLSCYYKIISKALNARLGKVIGKVTSMAQKAYNPERYLHEAIINTVETIRHCQNQNLEGMLVSVDLHKAFDSVFHEFMREVYKFFGFGEYFIRLSETLGNNRTAKIILENGRYSEDIDLLRCRPQGDSPSPRQFNMCQQICIFKIELDPRVRSVYLSFIVPRLVGGGNSESAMLATEEEVETAGANGYNVSHEVRTTKKKVTSFADDLQAAVKAEYETLSYIKESMIDFGIISGLCTNVEKTTIMRIGNTNSAMDPRIEDLGFTLVTEMKILGFLIDGKIERLGLNFDKIIGKMRQIVGNWSRFRLSLPGRIAIAKSLLLSQVTFPGTVLDPSAEQLSTINNIIEDFVTKGIVISKNRIYAHPKRGGLGLLNIENFLAAQKCAWIRRCFFKINDAWRWEFLRNTKYSLSTVRIQFFSERENPMLYNIAKAVCKFQVEYWKRDENYLEAPIFNNDFFLSERPRPRAAAPGCVGLNLIRRDIRNDHFIALMSLKMKSLIVDGVIVDYNVLCRNTGIPFSANEYLHLVTAAAYARERYGNKENSNGKNVCIIEGVYSKKGKSKMFRRYLDYSVPQTPITEIRTVKTFFDLIGTPVPDPDSCSTAFSIWNCQYLPNNVRFFSFQFFNNSLATGTRIAARYRNNPAVHISDLCAFCVRSGNQNPSREDFFHVFFRCDEIQNCIGRYLDKYGYGNMDPVMKKYFLFTGTGDGEWTADMELNIISNMIFLYGIWLCKLQKKIPNFTTVEDSMLTIFDNCIKLSHRLTETAGVSVSPICRLWRLRHRRG
jgi:hypothetical protein